jgi:RNA polymerase sigma factor (sigma-70 family)
MPPPPAELFASRVLLGPALRAQPDRRLVDLVRDGYDAAFEEIVRRYRKQLDRFATGIVGGRAEDVTQDAFSKALLALRGSEAEIELRPWLYRIVRNTALNDLRDRAPLAEELSEQLPGGRSAAAEAEAREELRNLMEQLGALPEPQRAALVMRELEGLSHEEIAAALGVSGGAARQAIYRARAALRDGFGLLVPLPALRALAGAGASSAGGAALGGLGGSALKAGAATVLIAGTFGAGVAIQHHHGHRSGPEAAEAAPLVAGRRAGAETIGTPRPSSGSGAGDDRSRGRKDNQGDVSSGHGGSGDRGGSLDSATRSGSSGGPSPSRGSHSGEGSHHSGDDGSHHSTSSGHGSGSGSDDSGSGSGGSGSDDSLTSGDSSGSSGSSSTDGGGSGSGSSGGSDDDLGTSSTTSGGSS